MHSFIRNLRTVAWSALLAFLITAFGQGAWGVLLTANFQTTPEVPWAVIVMAAVLWLMWHYLGGKGWPRSTGEIRRNLLRARPVSASVFAWVVLAGAL